MKSKYYLFLGFSLLLSQAPAQDKVAEQYSAQITAQDLKDNLSILSSDALEGRETGTRGQKMAAAFIRQHFKELGLKGPVDNDYYQTFNLYKNVPGEVYLIAGGTNFRNYEEIVYFGKDNSGGEVSIPVVFGGSGTPQELTPLDLTDKALVVLPREDDYRTAMSIARTKKARMVFVISTQKPQEFKAYIKQVKSFLGDGRPSLLQEDTATKGNGIFFISPAVAEKIFNTTYDNLSKASQNGALLKKVKQGKVVYKTSVDVKTIETENVLGFLEGTDKKDEVVVITAHYDHIGKKASGEGDLINNGADDDGSGTVAVLQLAKVFAQAKKDGKGPRRSILFMTVTGEESGLLGSEYYTDHPVFPLTKTVVNLNIDMIGRRDEQHRESAPYVYVIGSDKLSPDLHKINESVNKRFTNLVFDYTYNELDHPTQLYYRSDHWNFAKNNIPIIFYFDGIHEDYHLPSDEIEKIEFDLLTRRTQCVFHTAWEVANREQRLAVDEELLRK